MHSSERDIASTGQLFVIASEGRCSADERQRQILEAREGERRHIARDLHDVTAHLLLELEFSLTAIDSSDEPLKSKARASALNAISQLQAQVRCVSYLLHPPELDRFGLEKTLEALTLGMSERCGIDIRFRSRGYRAGIAEQTEMSMLRVAQEALMNIFKHSGSDRADFHLYCNRNWIGMRIRDYGIGKVADRALTNETGVGLAGMRERMKAVGGALTVRVLGGGTVVTAIAPIARAAKHCQQPGRSDSLRLQAIRVQ